MNLEVSVIIPVRNGANFVDAALESLFRQTRAVSEIIVVDDHSNDRTADIVMEYQGRVKLIRSQGSGQAAAINLGVKFVNNELVSFIDHDDLWHPDKNKRAVAAFEQNFELDVSCCGLTNFTESTGPSASRNFGVTRTLGACTFKRSAFNQVGPMNENLMHHAIVEWWARPAAQKLKVSEIPESLYLRRIHAKNSGVTFKDEARADLIGIIRGITRLRNRDDV